MPIIVADKNNVTDGSAFELLSRVKTDKTIVLVAWSEKYEFNPALLEIKGDYVLCCFCEYGWDSTISFTHIWGVNSAIFPRYYNNDWIKFDNWVKENLPTLLLKRELFKSDLCPTIKPIDYPARQRLVGIESKEQFNNRPISVFNYWGRSHEGRLILHGNIWIGATIHGYSVCDNIYQLNQFLQFESGQRWVTLAIPHYARLQIQSILEVNGVSKVSISFPGAGNKCFRHGEAAMNSVMAMENKDLAWAYDWNETNSIQFKIDEEIPTILDNLKNENLYEIYLKGIENCGKYYIDNYVKDYLEPLINA